MTLTLCTRSNLRAPCDNLDQVRVEAQGDSWIALQITVRTTARGGVKPLLNSLSTLVNTQAGAEIKFSCGVALLSILCAGS